MIFCVYRYLYLFLLLFAAALPTVDIRSVCLKHFNNMNILNRNWTKIFLLASLAILVLNIVGLVMNIIGIITIIGINVINIYCTFFSFLTFSAEIRQFDLVRRFVSVWLKYFTFLLFYKSRGVFYMMYGLLLIGNGILTTIAGFTALVLGIVMIVVSIFVPLPVFGDMKEAEANYQEKINEYAVESPHVEGDTNAMPVPVEVNVSGTPSSSKKKKSEEEEEQVLAGGWRPPRIVEEPVPEERTSPAPLSNTFNLRPADFITAEEEEQHGEGELGYNNFGLIRPSAFASRGSINNKEAKPETPKQDV